ncbi:hypothetical protein, partial [Anaerofustis stercorihominis]
PRSDIMDTYIKATIDVRKNIIFKKCNNYKLMKIAANLFERIYKLGEQCRDVNEFENKFLESYLSEKYKYLFEKVEGDLE